MTDTTAKIQGKGLDGTGFTEDLAASLFDRVGHNLKAIVELQVVDKHGPNLKGQRGITLVITKLEVADDTILEEHLRELSRTLYLNRQHDKDQPSLDGGDGINPKVGDVIQAGVRHRPHPFLPVDAADDNGICDVCGLIDSAGVHSTQDFLPTGDDTDPDKGVEDGGPDVDALTDEPAETEIVDEDSDPDELIPHTYDAGDVDGVCVCSLPFEDDIHAPRQSGDEPTVGEVVAAKERHLSSVEDPFAAPATT